MTRDNENGDNASILDDGTDGAQSSSQTSNPTDVGVDGSSNRIGTSEEENADLLTSMLRQSSGDREDEGGCEDEEEEEEWITVEEGIERIGLGWFQAKILIASGLCFAADAMQVILLSFLTLILKEEWSLSDGRTESITSCLFAGSLLGTLVLGPAADHVGRRPVFLVSAIIISIFGLGTALSNNYWTFMFLLFWVGFGVGGLVVPFDLLAEFLPSAGRGKGLLSIEYFWTLGCLYVVAMAYATLHRPEQGVAGTESGGHHWRTFISLCTLPCIVSLIIGALYVPESATWLAAEGRSEEALIVLRKAALSNGRDPNVLFPSNVRLQADTSHKNASIADLFTPAWREITFRLWGTWSGFAFGYYGTLLAITRVFEKDENNLSPASQGDTIPSSQGDMIPSSQGDTIDSSDYDFDYSAIFLSSSAELVGTTLVILLVDRVGRISAQVGCYLSAGVSVCLLCVLSASDYPRSAVVILGFIARAFEMGATITTWVSTAEILSVEVRSTGHSTANAMGRLGAFFCPFLVEGNMSLVEIGTFMLLIHLFTVFCLSKLPETRGREMGALQLINDYSDEMEGMNSAESPLEDNNNQQE